jgi:M3 family oligoendopeptidase
MTQITFPEIQVAAPDMEATRQAYEQFHQAYDAAENLDDALEVLQRWDQLRRQIDTWQAVTELRFHQDTRDEEAKQARDHCDQLRPKLTELSVNLKRKLLQDPQRPELEERMGKQAFSLWEAETTTYEPIIEEDLVQESRLNAQYTELLAGAQLSFQGQTSNLSEIVKYREDPDRNVRQAADQVRWQWFQDHRETLDDIFDQLVILRDGMAQKLGFDNFVDLGYQRMTRVDYNQQDVDRYRKMVLAEVTPFGKELRSHQARELGIEKTMAWDEAVYFAQGNPTPGNDYDHMIRQAHSMFAEIGYGLDDFFQRMVDGQFMDLKNRDGKAGGGFCTSFDLYGMPYIFANFNGTRGDVEVFTHEMGHAFQNYMSRDQPWVEYLWPTYESCEIHSMGLEFLTWPAMEKFFGQRADDFRRLHLASSLIFLPYGVAVDHFQHLIYENPTASPAERHTMWQELETQYQPWLDYGDLPHASQGGRWQSQRHIYASPFYYIDYTLAQTCALQFWLRAAQDRDQAMKDYTHLCSLGGQAPFQELVQAASLVSPFEAGCLSGVVNEARQWLGI